MGVSPLILGVGDKWENRKNNYHKSIKYQIEDYKNKSSKDIKDGII